MTELENIKLLEQLNCLDIKCLDENCNFIDLRSFYKSNSYSLSDEAKVTLSEMLKTAQPKDANKIYEFIKNPTIKLTESNNKLIEKEIPDYTPQKTGTAYKVFRIKNGKLYPPMVANAGNASTPVGVWLEAEEGEFAGLSKTGRKQVKSIGSGTLSYRPGWHLGDIPRASQFDRTNKETGEKEFPKDFVWARCTYVMDVDYQPESDEQGHMRTKPDGTQYRSDKYQHSLAGLTKMPKDGYYKYRTNPRPDTVPWVITGAMRVDELLDDYQVNAILEKNGIPPIHRQGGDKTLAELGIKNVNENITEAVNTSDLKSKIETAVNNYMLDQGFDEDDVKYYSAVDFKNDDDGYIHIEVRAEVSYEGLMDLCEILNPIVAKEDKESYFEPEEPGIISAYVYDKSLLRKEDKYDFLHNSDYDLEENINNKLSAQERTELKNLISSNNDINVINSYLQTKAQKEALSESAEKINLYDIKFNLLQFLSKNGYSGTYEVFNDEEKIVIEVYDGDWKHEHGELRMLLNQFFIQNNLSYELNYKDISDEEDSESDNYSRAYIISNISKTIELSEKKNNNDYKYATIIDNTPQGNEPRSTYTALSREDAYRIVRELIEQGTAVHDLKIMPEGAVDLDVIKQELKEKNIPFEEDFNLNYLHLNDRGRLSDKVRSNKDINSYDMQIKENLDEAANHNNITSDEAANKLAHEFYQYCVEKNVYIEECEGWLDSDDNLIISYEIYWGDWKHEHLATKFLAEEFFFEKGYTVEDVNEDIIDEDGSDTYSAHYDIKFEYNPILR